LLAIGSVEYDTALGKLVDVWRLDHRVTVAAKFRPQVVDGYEKNILSASGDRSQPGNPLGKGFAEWSKHRGSA
jgi:hypothetical protein